MASSKENETVLQYQVTCCLSFKNFEFTFIYHHTSHGTIHSSFQHFAPFVAIAGHLQVVN